jgi:hypothetical protein
MSISLFYYNINYKFKIDFKEKTLCILLKDQSGNFSSLTSNDSFKQKNWLNILCTLCGFTENTLEKIKDNNRVKQKISKKFGSMDFFTTRKASNLDYNSSVAGALLTSVGSIGDLCDDTKMHRIFRSNHTQPGLNSLFLLEKINENKNDGYICLNELHSDYAQRSPENNKLSPKVDQYTPGAGSNYNINDSFYQIITVSFGVYYQDEIQTKFDY